MIHILPQLDTLGGMDTRAPNLVQRTSKFGEVVIELAKTVRSTDLNRPLLLQIVRSGTSVGANYMEADCGESRKDFIHKLAIARKEAKETMYWARMLHKTNPESRDICIKVYTEGQELVKIFSSIIIKMRAKDL